MKKVTWPAGRHARGARGLDPEQAILFVIDGGKALYRAIKDVFGERALVHRCHRHKERNVCDLLPERDRPQILARIRGAWAPKDPNLAQQRLRLLASELDRTWPDAAASLREGMPETLTLTRLGIGGHLAKTPCSTNPRESMIRSSATPSATSSAAKTATCASAGPPPACSKRSSNSDESRATATSPSSSPPSNHTHARHQQENRPSRADRKRYRLTNNP
jgi:Transposase, Mutator family